MAQPLACMIATIGRPTLPAAIESALHQFDEVLVIADACDLNHLNLPDAPHLTIHRTGRRFDQYGSAAWNLGAYTTHCDWIAQLGDDDEWTPNATTTIQQAITNQPQIDVWIPGLQYNDGKQVCIADGLHAGNVAAPITKPEHYFTNPMTASHATHGGLTDYAHINDYTSHQLTIGWLHQPIYLVRPHAPGYHGGGQP